MREKEATEEPARSIRIKVIKMKRRRERGDERRDREARRNEEVKHTTA